VTLLIFCTIKHVFEKLELETIDRSILFSTAHGLGISIFQSEEGLKQLNKLFELQVNSSNIKNFVRKIANLEIARLMYETLTQARNSYLELTGEESVSDILGIAEEAVFNFTSTLDKSASDPQKIFSNVQERIEWLKENPQKLIGISTGLSRYDQAIGGGLRNGTINIL